MGFQEGKRVKGIEPSSLAWKAIALPLSYTRGAEKPPSEAGPECGQAVGESPDGMTLGSAGFEPAKAKAIRFTV
jgi:hypothetical protein